MSHIRNFHIGNSAAIGNLLKLTFKSKFIKCINFFTYIHMIGIGIISLICNIHALEGVISDVSPIHWQYGAIARLKKGEKMHPIQENTLPS